MKKIAALVFALLLITIISVISAREEMTDFGIYRTSSSVTGMAWYEIENSTFSRVLRARIEKQTAAIAGHFGVDPRTLYVFRLKGMGYLEMIRIILISLETRKDISEIVKMRKKKMSLHEICEEFKVDNSEIKKLAQSLKSKLLDK